MKIEENMIKERSIVGKRNDNSPVVMLVTHGGLYAFFGKSDSGDVETLGMAPHKAIAAWMSEKKARDIVWNDEFAKSEYSDLAPLQKSDKDRFKRLRDLIFSEEMIPPSLSNLHKKEGMDDYYLIYDTKKIQISIMHKSEIQSGLDSGGIYKESFVRSIRIDEPVEFLSQHREFDVVR